MEPVRFGPAVDRWVVVVLAFSMLALPFPSLARDVVELTWAYVIGRALGIPLEPLYTAERTYLQGHGRTRSITIAASPERVDGNIAANSSPPIRHA